MQISSDMFGQDSSLTSGVHGSFLIMKSSLWKGGWIAKDGVRRQNRRNRNEYIENSAKGNEG